MANGDFFAQQLLRIQRVTTDRAEQRLARARTTGRNGDGPVPPEPFEVHTDRQLRNRISEAYRRLKILYE